MSSQAWSDYEVPGSPYFLLVEEGRVSGEGSGSTWSQVRALLGQASDDTEVRRRAAEPSTSMTSAPMTSLTGRVETAPTVSTPSFRPPESTLATRASTLRLYGTQPDAE